ncbi:MAG: DNA translocase FtsK 4TM domain-containing protein [Patescibacteria group bacterium]
MSKKNLNKKKKIIDIKKEKFSGQQEEFRLHHETKKSVWAIIFAGIAAILLLARFKNAGPAGSFFYEIFETLFGLGYYLLPLIFLMMAGAFLISERRRIYAITFIGAALFIFSGLGLIDILFPEKGGVVGMAVGSLEKLFGYAGSLVIVAAMIVISILIVFNAPIKIKKKLEGEPTDAEAQDKLIKAVEKAEKSGQAEEKKEEAIEIKEQKLVKLKKISSFNSRAFSDYVFPPLDLLRSSVEKPTAGDLRTSANIIKRTLESFGIPVEMGEINIGPKVTRYTLKPAEGVKISRITALNSDLALALAAHPIRIEAPIPGKSLVGIEVPNKAAAVVRLGSLIHYPEFAAAGLIGMVLGRDVTGEPIFANIEKMPHLLIAGSTGSGKSIALHSLILSLLYKNSPETLKMVMIDPKRVELSVYDGLPHLISPVVTQTKKAANVFRWALSEMDKRYEMLQMAGSRDVQSYNKKNSDNHLPYIIIIIDELADLMSTYGREVEGAIVRLAQMARATGIHLIVSTQRPSVEVITGLIKANITSRIALQVASQIDSRTILDSAGAEKLLGGGDMLFVSSELSKPKRIQGAYVSEEEIKKVADFIRDKNSGIKNEEVVFENGKNNDNENGDEGGKDVFERYGGFDEEDELYEEAVEVVKAAQKASASLLQRRLKVGYARAARLLDIMEAKGIIGPGDGAKPREVYD